MKSPPVIPNKIPVKRFFLLLTFKSWKVKNHIISNKDVETNFNIWIPILYLLPKTYRNICFKIIHACIYEGTSTSNRQWSLGWRRGAKAPQDSLLLCSVFLIWLCRSPLQLTIKWQPEPSFVICITIFILVLYNIFL